ncbi:family 1 glycosylhydrolase [Sphingosinicella rhizophila]|uniref:dTDP-4-dehydrorhamnose reductase n=1 Tax=Sphingosinicella rhizophila TaxID=3050082 RepID=A0ABU3Q7H2_9SPHN|nr:family 1 glycosylhydrolase [Sphingosinicella sp. GR2756]MDT9599355.1 family 1 glycosylhydrolase [Sphingosinicella sp. GR2756]
MPGTKATRETSQLELWGGIECTIARVGDEYRDQVAETGHVRRPGDLDLITDLGIGTIRYPILWENVAPSSGQFDFSWTDERLAILRERGINVIGGLVHHGSGPRHTHLLDPDFPAKLGDYAARVAERYPWIEMWTPVNEPLTTARFSALYGLWYPHRRDYPSFLRALVNQCSGVAEAMRAIRAVNPTALLVQTEDLGKTFSTARLRYQAAHENERRWLSFDLLCGKVDDRHPWRRLMSDAGISGKEIDRLADGAARPDIIGINHYLTSERFLDDRTALYPDAQLGGNGRDSYIDAEAVRVERLTAQTGIGPRLREAWKRYGIPIAVTEVHHGCTRDEQLRWFVEVWRTAEQLKGEGIDLRAVTLWSLFGNVDWRSLLTRKDGVYDVGAFDARGEKPRPTLVAKAAKALAAKAPFDHPVLDAPGWWRRPERLYPWNGRCRRLEHGGRPLLITGATGTLGTAFARICQHRGLPYCLTNRSDLDICDAASIEAAILRHRPWAIVNTAGFVRVADAEHEQEACFAANAIGPERLARACTDAGIPLVTFSSDLVFDGRLGRPYTEDDEPRPTGTYGISKARAESMVLALAPQALLIRTSAFFGPWDRYNFAHAVLGALAQGEAVRACSRTEISPTYVPDLCHATLDLLIDGEAGLWHLANQGQLSWHEFAHRIAQGAGYDPSLVLPVRTSQPAITALASSRGALLRPLDHAIDAFLGEVDGLVARQPMELAAE